MLIIRFQRTGRTNDPAFRIVVSEHARHPKAGNPLQVVGSYNPKTKHTVIDAESVKHWISKGAQLSGTVHNLFITKGIIEGKKVNVLQKKNIKKEAQAEAAAPVASKVEVPEAEAKAEEAPAEAKTEPPAEAKSEEKKSEAPAPVAVAEAETPTTEEKIEEAPASV